MTRQINDAGLALIKQFETCQLTCYADQAGIPTIGWGHVVLGSDNLEIGDNITQEEADDWLAYDLNTIESVAAQFLTMPLNDNQYAAIISLCYNTGIAPLEGTLGKLLTAGDIENASDQFLRWDKVHIKGVLTVSQGLLNRRLAEQKLFNLPVSA